ncbi:MAG: prephenate dehydratase [Bacteroidetes bacterium]|nr:prephenate dehydratase [Bacteroidota bacterium]
MLKIAFQGERGAFSETASKKMFSENIQISPSFSFEDVFTKVKNNHVDYGVIPIENSLYGSVFESYDLLLQYSLTIIGELNLQINHHLLANQNYELNELKKIYSHPQALGQCSIFLKTLKNAELVPAYDTAGSALMLMNDKVIPAAAIASREAADIYKLKILKSNIQNNQENYTRFLAISKKQIHKEFKNPKTSICFELKSMPGALFRALSVFALRDIDLLKIESRPIPHKPFEYNFYLDMKGSLSDDKIKKALNHLAEISLSIKEFGTYEAGKTFKS